MIVNDTDKWLYIGISKTGSTSLHQYLTNKPFNGVNPFPEDQHFACIPFETRSYKIFSVVRNPFTRALSIWRHAVKNDAPTLGFLRFLEHKGLSEFYQSRQVDFLQYDVNYHLINMEDLYNGIKGLFDYNIPQVPFLNWTGSESYYPELTDTAKEMIVDYYSSDFERFGYSTSWDC